MLKRYTSDTSSDYYRLTDESLAVVREKLGILSLKNIYQQQLESEGKLRALESEVSILKWVEIRCETLEERVRKLEAENVACVKLKQRLPESICFIQRMRGFDIWRRTLPPGVIEFRAPGPPSARQSRRNQERPNLRHKRLLRSRPQSQQSWKYARIPHTTIFSAFGNGYMIH